MTREDIHPSRRFERKIFDKFGEEELLFLRNMILKNKNAYRMYFQYYGGDLKSPSYWFNNIRKTNSIIEDCLKDKLGDKYDEIKQLTTKEVHKYYSYIQTRERFHTTSKILSPIEWRDRKQLKDREFSEIAKQLGISIYAVKRAYLCGMKKLKKIIISNPKYRDLLDEVL